MNRIDTSSAKPPTPKISPTLSPGWRYGDRSSDLVFVAFGKWSHCDVTDAAMTTRNDVTNTMRVVMTTGWFRVLCVQYR